MEIAVLGLNHRTAPVDLRERVAFAPERLSEALRQIKQRLAIPECVVLSTCNRVELYCGLPAGRQAWNHVNGHRSTLVDFVSRFHALESNLIQDKLYWHLQPDSVKHLFRVAAGLDSMVLGESEILGQVKEAYQKAEDAGTTGRAMRGLFQQAFSVAKEIRTKTQICRGAVSVSSVAVELARKIFSDFRAKNILIFGAGQTGEATVRCLVGRGAEHVSVVNRSYANAQALAGQFGGSAVPLDDLETALVSSDIVICSTSADNFLLTRDQVVRLMRQRKNRPIFLIDISVPRNL
ncbi:MAG: glutamyl-tRNA reductase, partial [Candidatus Omnitrophica bacterium]|nr:glutamyl-tRNA reductase [Candidatus Omnitrophota bacterium]